MAQILHFWEHEAAFASAFRLNSTAVTLLLGYGGGQPQMHRSRECHPSRRSRGECPAARFPSSAGKWTVLRQHQMEDGCTEKGREVC